MSNEKYSKGEQVIRIDKNDVPDDVATHLKQEIANIIDIIEEEAVNQEDKDKAINHLEIASILITKSLLENNFSGDKTKKTKKQEAIYQMSIDCGRMGNLEATFICTKEEMYYLINNSVEVDFGEVLGKHSKIIKVMFPEYFKEISTNSNAIKMFKDFNLSTGHNPFEGELIKGMLVQDFIDGLIEQSKQDKND